MNYIKYQFQLTNLRAYKVKTINNGNSFLCGVELYKHWIYCKFAIYQLTIRFQIIFFSHKD